MHWGFFEDSKIKNNEAKNILPINSARIDTEKTNENKVTEPINTKESKAKKLPLLARSAAVWRWSN
jgi:hypothetical protein